MKQRILWVSSLAHLIFFSLNTYVTNVYRCMLWVSIKYGTRSLIQFGNKALFLSCLSFLLNWRERARTSGKVGARARKCLMLCAREVEGTVGPVRRSGGGGRLCTNSVVVVHRGRRGIDGRWRALACISFILEEKEWIIVALKTVLAFNWWLFDLLRKK